MDFKELMKIHFIDKTLNGKFVSLNNCQPELIFQKQTIDNKSSKECSFRLTQYKRFSQNGIEEVKNGTKRVYNWEKRWSQDKADENNK